MTVKLRFFTAKKLGKVEIQRIAAIEMIQTEWRIKIARKRFDIINIFFHFNNF